MALRKTLTAFAPFVRQPGPRALLAGNAISRFGDALDTVAFGWLVYRLTGSTLMMGMLYTVNALPGLIFGLAGGLLADRRPPARTFALLCALRGALVMRAARRARDADRRARAAGPLPGVHALRIHGAQLDLRGAGIARRAKAPLAVAARPCPGRLSGPAAGRSS